MCEKILRECFSAKKKKLNDGVWIAEFLRNAWHKETKNETRECLENFQVQCLQRDRAKVCKKKDSCNKVIRG